MLDNNHVEYEHDYKVKNRAETAVYRLDFLINGNIDFEVDGSEHEEYLYRDDVLEFVNIPQPSRASVLCLA